MYSNSSIKGPYSFLVNNWLLNPSDNPVGHLGIVNLDGAGNLTISHTINVDGTVGTYTGTLNFMLADAGLTITNAIVPR